MAHGAGGRLSRELTERIFMPRLQNPVLAALDDQAKLHLDSGDIAFTTDTFVVTPFFFPGGTIGDLAVNGTVNDLAVGGAIPRYLGAGFVIEEGFSLKDLETIVQSIASSAEKAGVQIVAGDTKVVQNGQCDGIFINTSGIGTLRPDAAVSCAGLAAGDVVILSGTLGDHGMAVMTAREGLSFSAGIVSDTAALNGLIAAVLDEVPGVRAMRDPTRGGLAATLNEWAEASGKGIAIDEAAIPVRDDVRGACELLGIDPLNVANEGKVVLAVPRAHADAVLRTMREHADGSGREAVAIGEVVEDHPGTVVMRNVLGSRRIVEMPLGEQLPRIC